MSNILSRLFEMSDEEAALFSHYDAEKDALFYKRGRFYVYVTAPKSSGSYWEYVLHMPYGKFHCKAEELLYKIGQGLMKMEFHMKGEIYAPDHKDFIVPPDARYLHFSNSPDYVSNSRQTDTDTDISRSADTDDR